MSLRHFANPPNPEARRDTGAVALEYGLLATLVAVVAAAGVELLGVGVLDLFQPAIDLL